MRPLPSRTPREFSSATTCVPSRRRSTTSIERTSPSASTRRTKSARSGALQYSITELGNAYISSAESVTEHLHEGAVHRDQPAVARALVHAFDDALEQAAELGLAGAQRLLGEIALDGERGEARGVRLQHLLARVRQPGLGTVDGHRA